MKFNRKIYNVDWQRLITQLTPVNLRQPKLMALLTAIVSPIVYVYSRFINYKLDVAYRLGITPQVCYLEKYLNDHYDYDLRRIKIIDPDYWDTAELYLAVESKELVMYNASEVTYEGVFYTEAESAVTGVDFFIKLPVELIKYAAIITAQINKLKLPTKKFEIING